MYLDIATHIVGASQVAQWYGLFMTLWLRFTKIARQLVLKDLKTRI